MAISSSETLEQAQIRSLEAAFSCAFNRKDVDAMMALFVSGRDWEQYRASWARFFERLRTLRHTITDLRIETSGNLGYSYSLHHVTGTLADDGKRMDYTVRVTNVYKKFGSEWLIVQEHASFPFVARIFEALRQ